jgi:signal transduction histidine kinase
MISEKESRLEPDLQRVFRWYVIVRAAFLVLSTLVNIFWGDNGYGRQGQMGEQDFGLFAIITTIELLLLFFYLSWPWLQCRLGKLYLPLALAFAAAGLIFEQYLFSGFHRIWQPLPFLYILLILTAWQYRYPAVLVFGAGASGLEITLARLFPLTRRWGLPPFEPDVVVIYGRLAASLASYLVLGFVVNRLVQAQREQRQKLVAANLKLVQHASTVEQLTISRERNRLSRELHDTLAHTLSALAVQFDALATVWEAIPDKARQLIEKMQDTTRTGLDETRRSLRDLRASPLEELGLILAIREMAEDLAEGDDLHLMMDLPEELGEISHEVEQCFYRVAQEAFANIARHAQATEVSVRFDDRASGLAMQIADNGVGFNLQQTADADHLGLRGMHERAKMVAADLQVESQPGEGTTLRLILEENS